MLNVLQIERLCVAMSSMVSRYLVIAVLLVVVVFQLYLYQESLKREQFLQHQISNLQQQVVDIDRELSALKVLVVKLDEGSLDNMVDEANEAFISGWEALMDTVDKELQKARESLRAEDEPAVQKQKYQGSSSAGRVEA